MNITEFVINREIVIRLGFFFGIFGAMALWEWAAPRRALAISKSLRWGNNIGIVIINSLLLHIIFPSAGTGMAIFAKKHGWGRFTPEGVNDKLYAKTNITNLLIWGLFGDYGGLLLYGPLYCSGGHGA